VEYLHKRGIVYRDLKPENVLLQADGHIMLTDFDLSLRLSEREHFVKEEVRLVPEKKKQQRSASLQIKSMFVCGAAAEGSYGKLRAPKKVENSILSRVTPVAEARNPQKGGKTEPRSNSLVGTVEYLAPEVVLGSGHSWQVDWWTLGIFLFEIVYGKTPFRSENGGRKEIFYNILTKDPEIPGPMSPLKDLLQKLLEKDPTQRLGTNGADEIKNHPFFSGVQWDSLQFICRPPYVPPQLMVAEIDAGEVERNNLARPARHAHAEKSAGEVEQEQMQRETFGDLSTYRKVVLTQNLQEGADPDTSQCQEEQTPLAAMPDFESGPDLHVSTQKQSEESEPYMITSSQSWSGSEFVKSWTEDSISHSGKFWMQFDGHKQISSSNQENRSVVNGMNQVLMQMKRDHPESIKMIEYF
jgi:serine/threonine protein kinase